VDVGSGLNYLDANGNFQPSRDLIELMQDGSAAALRGPIKAYFSPDLSVDDAITLVTISNRVFQTHPIGQYYVDGDQSVLFAPVQDSAVAELLPPNRVLYRGAFAANGFEADLLLTYTKQRLESDVLLIQKPKSPDAFGLNPETSLLQVRHAWLNVPVPKRSFNAVESGLVDETLDFGELWFPTGKAFTWSGAESADTNAAARLRLPGMSEDGRQPSVAKHWEQVATNLGILSESVLWRDLVPLLAELPETARKSEDSNNSLIATVDQEASASTGRATGKSFKLAQAPYRPSGLVLDYVAVVGGGNYTFTSGTTYYLSNGCTFASITFQAGAFLKYDTNGYLSAYSSVTCPASGKVIMTAADDNQYGQAFGSGNPKYYDRALIVYSIANTTIRNLQVRWAGVGAYYLYSANNTLSDCSLFQCSTGVKAEYSSSVTLVNDTQCAVTTPTITASGSTITGTLAVDCGVISVAMVNDPNRDLSDLDTNKNGHGGTYNGYVNFCADDYTWAVADSNYFYFAWSDRSESSGTAPNTRPDADIKLAKVRQ